MKQSKNVKLESGKEIKVTGLPMDKGIDLMNTFQRNEKEGNQAKSLIDFANFVEMKKCFIPVIIKKPSEEFEGGNDFYIEDDLLTFTDLSNLMETLISLSFGEEKVNEMKKKAEDGKDMISNG